MTEIVEPSAPESAEAAPAVVEAEAVPARRNKNAEQRIRELLKKVHKLEAENARLRQPSPPPLTPDPEALALASEERAQAERGSRLDELRRELETTFQAQAAEARQRHPDFDSVLASGFERIPADSLLAAEILQSEQSAEVGYFIARNPQLIELLLTMEPRELRHRVRRIAYDLEALRKASASDSIMNLYEQAKQLARETFDA